MPIRNILWMTIFMFIVVSCDENQAIQNKISKLEEALEEDSSNEKAAELSALYQSYVDQFEAVPESAEINGRYLYRAAGLEIRMGNTDKALKLLRQALKDFHSSSNTANNAALLEKIYRDQLKNEVVANSIYQAMLKSYPDAVNKDVSLPEGTTSLEARLDTMRLNIFDEKSYSINFQMANNYISSVEGLALISPNLPEIPSLLFKGGEIARSIQTYNKAIELLAWINEKYPDSKENPQAMFLRAFTLDDGLKEFDQAKEVYQAFIDKYPDNPFADDAKFSIENLGKDINELIDNFNENSEVQE